MGESQRGEYEDKGGGEMVGETAHDEGVGRRRCGGGLGPGQG